MKNLKLLFVLICTSILFVSCGEENYEMLTRGGDYPANDPEPSELCWEVHTYHQYNELGGYVLVDIKTNKYGSIYPSGFDFNPYWATIAVPNSYINPIGIMLPSPKWVTLIDENEDEVEVFTILHETPPNSPVASSSVVFQGDHQFIIRIDPNYDGLRCVTFNCGPLPGQVAQGAEEIDVIDIDISQSYSPYRIPEWPATDNQKPYTPPPYSAFNEYGGYILLDINRDSDWVLSFSEIVDWITFGIPSYYIDPEAEVGSYVFIGPYGEEATTYSIPPYTQTNATSGTGNSQYLIVLAPNDTDFPRVFSFSLEYVGPEENGIGKEGMILQYPISL